MTEQLTLQPDQHYRECGCPTWVLRCAHWEGRVLLAHVISFKAPSGGAYRGFYICLRKEEWPASIGELTEEAHGGEVQYWPTSMSELEDMWPLAEADFLAGKL